MSTPKAEQVRCAIYCRKSSEEGLAQDFNSLDAQRESGEAYVLSQRPEGWVCLPTRYDDGGYSGGTMDRPALKRLLDDVQQDKVDAVVIYKIDRLSRSLLDFTRLTEIFDRHEVKLVATTQHFSTATSMGRLTLNMMLSFAQFEREIIGERIRDKLAATRRKGKWAGGKPLLGYDVDRSNLSPRLAVNPEERERVQAIFRLYLEMGSLLPVVEEVARRGWTNKCWTTRRGRPMGGRPFDRPTLYALLINPMFVGKVSHKGELFNGEHEAIVDADTFERVQAQLKEHGRIRSAPRPKADGPLLRGLLRCACCRCAMTHTRTGSGVRKYTYYVCSRANRGSRALCPTKSVSAARIEQAVVADIADVLKDRPLQAEVRRTLRSMPPVQGAVPGRIAYLADQTPFDFARVWTAMSPAERISLINLMVERIELDGGSGSLEIVLRDIGIAPQSIDHLEDVA